jgi:hypothetical protein
VAGEKMAEEWLSSIEESYADPEESEPKVAAAVDGLATASAHCATHRQ